MSGNKAIFSGMTNYAEISPALANINFDFTLYRMEAPPEFQGVGSALSRHRKESAESGSAHKTARKLGALFERLIPRTPSLLKAYGLRASEIIASPKLNLKENREYGFFADQVGADATNIWAAATSGEAALAVHLLACLLARVWDSTEATTIWWELVQQRKQEINSAFSLNQAVDPGTLLAAQQDFNRGQLRDWDASARAWLRVADEAMKKQQLQARLIVDNLEKITMNAKTNASESVLEAWKEALERVDCLVKGEPQKCQSGATPLGLLSWHLYPDMVVVGQRCCSHVVQGDSLIKPGGVLTLGLEMSTDEGRNGITWSLPLAYLRYYGPPVIANAQLNMEERSRLSLDELMFAALGCILQSDDLDLSTLNDANHSIVNMLLQLLQLFAIQLERSALKGIRKAKAIREIHEGQSWLHLLLSTATSFWNLKDSERKIAKKLLRLGIYHGSTFLGCAKSPLFGILKLQNCLEMMKEDDRIALLREVAKSLPYQPDQIFIRYRHEFPARDKQLFEYATALPLRIKRLKRSSTEEFKECHSHYRWLIGGEDPQKVDESPLSESLATVPVEEEFVDFNDFDLDHLGLTPAQMTQIQMEYSLREKKFASLGEEVASLSRELIKCRWHKQSINDRAAETTPIISWRFSEAIEVSDYTVAFGNAQLAALFVKNRVSQPELHSTSRFMDVSLQFLVKLFQEDRIEHAGFVNVLCEQVSRLHILDRQHLSALKVLDAASRVYKKLSGATIDVRVLKQPLTEASWAEGSHRGDEGELSNLNPWEMQALGGNVWRNLAGKALNRSQTFSCICMFESGRFDIPPSSIENAVAMSSENSMFIAASLLRDPAAQGSHSDVQRVIGNVGRAGIAFLVLPEKPMMKEQGLDVWQLINHETFDKQRIDSFSSTTLHLSFTGSVFFLDIGETTMRDKEVYRLQSVVSVHDRGKWVADLDVTIDYSKYLYSLKACDQQLTHQKVDAPIISIDNWPELLDHPQQHAIVRAHGNWQARLAAASMCLARDIPTRLMCANDVCWACLDEHYAKCKTIIFID